MIRINLRDHYPFYNVQCVREPSRGCAKTTVFKAVRARTACGKADFGGSVRDDLRIMIRYGLNASQH